jgi:hypothetical protein
MWMNYWTVFLGYLLIYPTDIHKDVFITYLLHGAESFLKS